MEKESTIMKMAKLNMMVILKMETFLVKGYIIVKMGKLE